ncbi:MAG TPA: hypothetical protein VHK44_10355, partial [Xanthobacteraceae bacterium]|nr:hypothetical protein [Xanthobacteraceae bacterium]
MAKTGPMIASLRAKPRTRRSILASSMPVLPGWPPCFARAVRALHLKYRDCMLNVKLVKSIVYSPFLLLLLNHLLNTRREHEWALP